MSTVIVRYDGEEIGRVHTNRSLTTEEAAELAGIDVAEMIDADTPKWDPNLFDIEYVEYRPSIGGISREYVHDATGFDNGDEFATEEQVREYFTTENIAAMFGECALSQEQLDEMAEAVIANGWHMADA